MCHLQRSQANDLRRTLVARAFGIFIRRANQRVYDEMGPCINAKRVMGHVGNLEAGNGHADCRDMDV